MFDHSSTVGLVRFGDRRHPGSGLVLLMSNGEDGEKTVSLGRKHAGEKWHDFTGCIEEEVTVGANGKATFTVCGRNLAVWVRADV